MAVRDVFLHRLPPLSVSPQHRLLTVCPQFWENLQFQNPPYLDCPYNGRPFISPHCTLIKVKAANRASRAFEGLQWIQQFFVQ